MSSWFSQYLPEPVQAVRLFCLKQLPSLLDHLFDDADDTLFELADKAVSNAEQTIYFDSMREVRIKREEIESVFLDHIRSSFSHIAAGPETVDRELIAADELSLLQHETVEEDVAIRSMVSKVDNRYSEPLDYLTRRLGDLLAVRELTIHDNPVGGNGLCEAFKEACKELSLNIKARLVVYQLFDRHVLASLDELYFGSNKILVAAGVLPKIGPVKPVENTKQPQIGKASKKIPQRKAKTQAGPENDIFGMLRELLAVRQGKALAGASAVASDQKKVVLAQKDLLRILSQLQSSEAAGAPQVATDVHAVAGALDLAGVVNNLLKSEGKESVVAGLDKDIIDLVSMLFEFILEDAQLSAPMKKLLARLQIPMLKVALMDNTFFSQAGHPARRLLNELAQAAIGWSGGTESKKDPLFRKITEIIETIVNEFKDDLQLFQLLLEGFAAFAEIERRRAELIEKRTRKAEEGLGKTQKARAQVSEVINSRAVGKELPEVVLQLIQEGWSNYLFYLLAREGKGSEAWNEAVKTLDDLIWSAQPKSGAEERKQLLQKIPGLLARLREGLGTISFSSSRMRDMFKGLELFHKLRLHPVHASVGSAVAEFKAVDRDVVVNPLQAEQKDVTFDDDHYLEQVDQMRSGAWVEFVNKDASVSRAKLVAVIKATGKYIFVNRVGMKVAEKSRFSLAIALRDKKISVLEDGLIFDSALESVIVQLREDKDD